MTEGHVCDPCPVTGYYYATVSMSRASLIYSHCCTDNSRERERERERDLFTSERERERGGEREKEREREKKPQ